MTENVRRCIFCENKADSREDAWPLWLLKPLIDAGHGGIVGEVDGTLIDPPKRTKLLIRCVCARCNNGWMSEYEQAVKPIISPLIESSRLTHRLTTQDQQIVSLWAMKTAMVLEYTRGRRQKFYTSEDRYGIRMSPAHLPNYTIIWLACYRGWRAIYSEGTILRNIPSKEHAPVEAYVTNFSRGFFAFQVLTVRPQPNDRVPLLKPNPGPWRDATALIWPSLSVRRWPPDRSLDESLYERFTARFAGSLAPGPLTL